jgi:phospholipase/lecithinase/hemolysin
MTYRSHHPSQLVVFGDSLSDNGNLFDLIGLPPPPAWHGRASNGPTYAEDLARLLHMRLDDRAFAAAEASNASAPVLVDPVTGLALPINLSDQIAGYLADLHGHRAPRGTTALINIGSNDYEAFFQSPLPKTPQAIQAVVQNVVGSIALAIDALTQAGIDKIVLFTLPDFGSTPAAQAQGPQAVAFAHALDLANNAALAQMAAGHANVQVVDVFQLTEALAADPHSFGFSANLNQTWVGQLAAGSHQFAPNEVGFFDGIHPTAAAHGIIAAFADAVLTSDSTQFLDGTQNVIHAGRGDNFIFAIPVNPADPHLNDDYAICGGSGADIIFAGAGNVTVHGGSGNDLIAAGSGNAMIDGDNGTDVLETNSVGTNSLAGGDGDDALIVNRGGTNTMLGGTGNDIFMLKESAGTINPNGGFDFGQQVVVGGNGHDTLRFIINDQNPAAENALIAEFHPVEFAFEQAARHGHAGNFDVDGLHVSGIERLELQIDRLSTNPEMPYLITHDIALAEGHGAEVSAALSQLLQTAEHWNLLTV